MGATASRARTSPSMPKACILFEPKESVTRLFTVPHYSEWARMRPGTELNFDYFFTGGLGYRLDVYPAGFDEESADYIAVFLSAHRSFKYLPEGTRRIVFEILDDTGKAAVFNNHTAESGQETLEEDYPISSRGYMRFVKRSELETSSCVRRRDDSLVIRCTVSIHARVNFFPTALSSLEPESNAEDEF